MARRRPRAAAAAAAVLVIAVVALELTVGLVWLTAPQGPRVPVAGEALPLRVVGDPPETPWLALAVRKHAPRRFDMFLRVTLGHTTVHTDTPTRTLPRAVRETMLRRTMDAAWVAANDLAGTPVATDVHALVGRGPALEPYAMVVAVDGDGTDVLTALRRAKALGPATEVLLTIENPLGRTTARVVTVGDLADLSGLVPWRVAKEHAPPLDLPSRIRGGSIGLVAALLYLDRVTPGDLAGGSLVAASGAIDPAGTVGRVASLPWKLDAAAAAGATTVLVPRANGGDLTAATDSVIAVGSLVEAVTALCATGATASCDVLASAVREPACAPVRASVPAWTTRNGRIRSAT